VTLSVAASQGKKIDEGTMMSQLELEFKLESESEFKPVTVADPFDAQTLNPDVTRQRPNILTNWTIQFCDIPQKSKLLNESTTYPLFPSFRAIMPLFSSRRRYLPHRDLFCGSHPPMILCFRDGAIAAPVSSSQSGL
jgi:hypothetical protein